MNKNELIKTIKEIFNLNNEQESKNYLNDLDILIEELYKRMEGKNIKKVKIGKYLILEIAEKSGREYKNPRTKEISYLPNKIVRKIRLSDKINEI